MHVEARDSLHVLFGGGIHLLKARSLTGLELQVRMNCLAMESSCAHLLGAGITSSCHCVLLLFMAILGIELGSVYLHENMFPAEPSPQPLFYYISIQVRGWDLRFETH